MLLTPRHSTAALADTAQTRVYLALAAAADEWIAPAGRLGILLQP
jgi:hypothetical protein